LNVPTGFKYLEAYISTAENDDDPPNQNGKVESDGRSKDDTISCDKMVQTLNKEREWTTLHVYWPIQ